MSSPSTSPISDYLISTLKEIQISLPRNARIDDSIKFEITTVSQQTKGGKVNVGVLNVGAKVGVDISENQTQKVSFAIKFPTSAEFALEGAIMAKAYADKAMSEQTLAGLNQDTIG